MADQPTYQSYSERRPHELLGDKALSVSRRTQPPPAGEHARQSPNSSISTNDWECWNCDKIMTDDSDFCTNCYFSRKCERPSEEEPRPSPSEPASKDPGQPSDDLDGGWDALWDALTNLDADKNAGENADDMDGDMDADEDKGADTDGDEDMIG